MGAQICNCIKTQGVQIVGILLQQLGLDFTPEEWTSAHNAGTVEENTTALSNLGIDIKSIASSLPSRLTKAVFIACNTYTRPDYSLGVGPMNDAITVAHYMKSIGFTVYFIHNPKSTEFKQYLPHFVKVTQEQLLVYYTGHGASVADKDGDEADSKDEALVFDDAFVTDDVLAQLLASAGKPAGSKVVLLNDCCHSGSIWDLSKPGVPANVLCLSAARDAETAKQTSVNGTDQGIFTFYFYKLLTAQPNMTPEEVGRQIGSYLTRFEQQYTASWSTQALLEQPIFP
jgi:hypothetical protein